MTARSAYRPAEVAARVGVSTRTVRRWIAAGALRATRRGRAVLVPAAALEDLVEGELAPATAPRSDAAEWAKRALDGALST